MEMPWHLVSSVAMVLPFTAWLDRAGGEVSGYFLPYLDLPNALEGRQRQVPSPGREVLALKCPYLAWAAVVSAMSLQALRASRSSRPGFAGPPAGGRGCPRPSEAQPKHLSRCLTCLEVFIRAPARSRACKLPSLPGLTSKPLQRRGGASARFRRNRSSGAARRLRSRRRCAPERGCRR